MRDRIIDFALKEKEKMHGEAIESLERLNVNA